MTPFGARGAHAPHVLDSIIPWSRVVPGLMALLLLLMPVSYRAGSDDAHPHAVFQPLLDRVSGQPHHHHDHPPEPSARAARVSAFVPPGIPLGAARDLGDTGHPLMAGTDVPTLTDVHPTPDLPPMLAATIGLLLSVLIAAIRRPWLRSPTVPDGIAPTPDPPPPRHAPAPRHVLDRACIPQEISAS